MTLPGCARDLAEAPLPQAVAVKVEDRAPAELTRCPLKPDGFPESGESWAIVPGDVRTAIVGLAEAYAAATAQLERLIAWETGEKCPEPVHDAG